MDCTHCRDLRRGLSIHICLAILIYAVSASAWCSTVLYLPSGCITIPGAPAFALTAVASRGRNRRFDPAGGAPLISGPKFARLAMLAGGKSENLGVTVHRWYKRALLHPRVLGGYSRIAWACLMSRPSHLALIVPDDLCFSPTL